MALSESLQRIYERVPLGMRLGIEAMQAACARAGNPERAFPVVHVAGTNGKGSVCAMVDAIGRAQGKKTGLYTSPHLCRFAERIRIDGEPVTDEALDAYLGRALEVGHDLSFFETATLAAFLAFRDMNVDIAVLEVGLGGRLDATNVVPTPKAAAITRIALDHTDRLGTTLEQIAREKAGIAKPGLDIVLGPMTPQVRGVIAEEARERGAITSSVEGQKYPPHVALVGEHQRENARIAALLGMRIGASTGAIDEGLKGVKWPGRLEKVGNVLLDAAHNPDGALALATHVGTLGLQPSDVTLIFGTLGDKDWRPMLETLAPLATKRIYVAPSGASRNAVAPDEMNTLHAGAVRSTMESALGEAHGAGLVIVAGSLVLVGQARAILLGLPRDPSVAL